MLFRITGSSLEQNDDYFTSGLFIQSKGIMGSSGGWEEVERVDEQTVIYQVLTEVNLPCEFKVDDITVKVGQDENKAWRVGVRMPEQKGWTWQTLPAFDPGYRHPKFPTS